MLADLLRDAIAVPVHAVAAWITEAFQESLGSLEAKIEASTHGAVAKMEIALTRRIAALEQRVAAIGSPP